MSEKQRDAAGGRLRGWFGRAERSVGAFVYKYRFLWRRIGIALLTLVLAIFLIFFLLRFIPGSSVDLFARTLATQRNIPFDEARVLAIQILGYDPEASVFEQFFGYVGNLFQGNMGQSLNDPNLTVNKVISKSLPWTLFLSVVSLAISFVLGILMGSRMVWSRNKAANSARMSYIVVSSAFPDFIFGLLMLTLFSSIWPIFPTSGAYDINFSTPGFNLKFIADCLYHGALPIISYVFIQTGGWALTMRGNCISVLGDDYIYAAKARGIPDRLIASMYLRKNAMLPLITSLAITFAATFGGSPLMENIFNYPGIGQQFNIFIGAREYFMILGILFFESVIIIAANLVTDSVYSLIDPRVRTGV